MFPSAIVQLNFDELPAPVRPYDLMEWDAFGVDGEQADALLNEGFVDQSVIFKSLQSVNLLSDAAHDL
jgi:hypothetical protein